MTSATAVKETRRKISAHDRYIQIRCSRELIAIIKRYANHYGVSMSEYLRQVIMAQDVRLDVRLTDDIS